MPLLFSYGTLQEENVQLTAFGRRLDGQRDALPRSEPSLVKIEDAAIAASLRKTHHANVTFNGNENSRVAGTVFEISDDELERADGYEAPFSYQRILATLASGKQAWVYVHREA